MASIPQPQKTPIPPKIGPESADKGGDTAEKRAAALTDPDKISILRPDDVKPIGEMGGPKVDLGFAVGAPEVDENFIIMTANKGTNTEQGDTNYSSDNLIPDYIITAQTAQEVGDPSTPVYSDDVDTPFTGRTYPDDVTTSQESGTDSGASAAVSGTPGDGNSGNHDARAALQDDVVHSGDTDKPFTGATYPGDVTYTEETQVDSGQSVELPVVMGVVDEADAKGNPGA